SGSWQGMMRSPYMRAWLAQMLVLMVGSMFLATRRGRTALGLADSSPGWRATLVLAIGALVHYVFAVLFVQSEHWHFASATSALALVSAALGQAVLRRPAAHPFGRRIALGAGFACIVLSAGAAAYRFHLQRTPAAGVRSYYEA